MFCIKERTSKGSAGPFIEAQRKGSVEPQYENGIRGNANFDSVDPFESDSEKFVRKENSSLPSLSLAQINLKLYT